MQKYNGSVRTALMDTFPELSFPATGLAAPLFVNNLVTE